MTKNAKHQPAPLAMWAVITESERSRSIHYPSIARTRADAIDKYLGGYELPGTTWAECANRGCTVERVTVAVDHV